MKGGEPAVTFDTSGRCDDVVAALSSLSYVMEPSASTRTTILDTFDGRLSRRGFRLRVETAARTELVLSRHGCDMARTAVSEVPHGATDLPAGDPWTSATALIGIRALLPRVSGTSIRRTGFRRNSAGDLVALVHLVEDVEVEGDRRRRLPGAAVEIRAVGSKRSAARRTAATLEALGFSRIDADTADRCAQAAGVDLAGFRPTATVPLPSDLSSLDGVRLVLSNLAASIDAHWDGTVEQLDTEFLHQLRIAIRRTRTILAEARTALPNDVVERVGADLTWLSQKTSTPRDLDVTLLNWASDVSPLGNEAITALRPVQALLERHRDRSHAELNTALGTRRARQFRQQWPAWLAGPVDELVPDSGQRSLGGFVAKRVQRSFRALVRDGRAVDDESPASELHELRKDAKRLRYFVECFGSILPEGPTQQLTSPLKSLQDVLGRHQDAEVHALTLTSLVPELASEGAPAETMIALGRLLERLDSEQRTARAEFAVRFTAFDHPTTRRAVDTIVEHLS